MDKEKLVDDIPSIKLKIKSPKSSGLIHLSSFYGSYNYSTKMKIKKNQEYSFSCPHCEQQITSDLKCDECSAKLVPLNIREGGSVRFCSRANCKYHNVKLHELSLIHDYMVGNIDNPNVIDFHNNEEKEAEKELIKSGTFLRIYCPHCENGLIEKGSVIFKIKNVKKELGYLLLSPYLNVFHNKSTVYIPEGAVVEEILCPFCEESLFAKDIDCEDCNSPAVEVQVAAIRRMIDFYFCSKKGCHWHNLNPKDMHFVLIQDSDYW
jgi:ssDNA-binding Zn-finger/Zn-ribbon topoisomerase 1